MNYIIYKITNTLNGNAYIGVHKCAHVEDSYMGSGNMIKQAIRKYGKDSFTKEILFVFDSLQDALNKERELVNDIFVSRKDTYNLTLGGGYTNIDAARLGRQIANSKGAHIKGGAVKRKMVADTPEWYREIVERQQATKRRRYYDKGIKLGRQAGVPHTEESKLKMSLSKVGQKLGVDNSQHGTFWITDGTYSKKCRDVNNIPNGWSRGRVIRPKT